MRAALLLALALPALGAPSIASAASIKRSPVLWSTVDVCNTSRHPLTVGVRGSMPGSGVAKERMFMRFRLQYRNPAGAWSYVGAQADSGYVPVGAATFPARQSGHSFQIAPRSGTTYVLRGVVSFEWRRGSRVVRHAQKATSAGRRTGPGSDPNGYSAAACTLG